MNTCNQCKKDKNSEMFDKKGNTYKKTCRECNDKYYKSKNIKSKNLKLDTIIVDIIENIDIPKIESKILKSKNELLKNSFDNNFWMYIGGAILWAGFSYLNTNANINIAEYIGKSKNNNIEIFR